MKYANWDEVVGKFTRVDAPDAGGATDVAWTVWCVRRGPKELARRQEATRADGPFASVPVYMSDGHSWVGTFHDVQPSLSMGARLDYGPLLLKDVVDDVLSDMRSMADWYVALPERDRSKFPRMSFDEAKRASEAWHLR